MVVAPIPSNESERLKAVHALNIDYNKPEERFDRIARITHLVFNVSCVFITLITKDRVLSISTQGCPSNNEPRDISFCGHTIADSKTSAIKARTFEVVDTLQDTRFYDNPYVIGPLSARYYIGFALQSVNKKNIGTLCMVDSRPRHLSAEEKLIFTELGLIAEAEINRDMPLLSSISNYTKIKELANKNDDSSQLIFDVFSQTNNLLKEMDHYLKRRNINVKEWQLLNEIAKNSKPTPSIVSANTNLKPSLVSKLLDSLENKKLVVRVYSEPSDRRRVGLINTDKGKELWLFGISYLNMLTTPYENDLYND
jgi:DNA-binding MarR family transcriptional regulator